VQRVAVRCSVLQCVAVYCNVLQCVAVGLVRTLVCVYGMTPEERQKERDTQTEEKTDAKINRSCSGDPFKEKEREREKVRARERQI